MVGQELIAKPDERKGAPNYHQFSIGVFKPEEEGNKMNTSDDLALVDHIPLEYHIKFTIPFFESRQR